MMFLDWLKTLTCGSKRLAFAFCVLASHAFAVEYEYRPTAGDPFVPAYLGPKKLDAAQRINRLPLQQRFELKGVWKSNNTPWRAVISPRPAESEAAVNVQPITVQVGDSIDRGIKVVSIEEQAVWLGESVELEDGRVFIKRSRLAFDEGTGQ